MSGNSGRPGRGPPPTTTTSFVTSSSPYYMTGNQHSSGGSFYPMDGQPSYDYGAAPYGSGLGQQSAYAGMSNTPYELAPTAAPTAAPGGGLPPMSTFDQSAQYPSNPYGPPLANRGPPPPYQASMSMPSNTPPYLGRGRSSTATGQPPVLRPNRGGSPIRRRRHPKQSSSRGTDSVAAGAGGGQAPPSVGAPPNPIHGFGPAIPAGLAAPPPQGYSQGGYGQGYGSQHPGNQYLGPRNLGQFSLSTSQSQVGSSNDLAQSGAQVPQPKNKIKRWKRADKETLDRMHKEGKTFGQIGEALGCTESEAESQHQALQRQSDAQEEARGRVSALANTSKPVPLVERRSRGVKWTMADAVWMEQRLKTLTRDPENRYKTTHEVLEMVAAEINFVNGTTVSPSVVEGTLSKLSAERSGRKMDWS